MSTLSLIIFASLAVSLVSFVGGLFLLWRKIWTLNFAIYPISFAAGVMLSTAFLDLLPEAIKENETTLDVFFFTLLGVIIFFFLERFVLWFHHHDEPHDTKPTATLILLGDGLHNFIDGVAIAASFITNPSLGFATTMAIAAHEIPQEIADLSVLIYAGMGKRRALIFNFISGLTAILGAILGFLFLDNLKQLLPMFLAFTAGMFIYIACSDLIPDIHKNFQRKRSWIQAVLFVLGLVVSWGFVKFLEG